MRISQIQTNHLISKTKQNIHKSNTLNNTETHTELYSKAPLSYHYGNNINFGQLFENKNRTVPFIDYEEYCAMSENTKKRFRKKYKSFFNDKTINTSEMIDQGFLYMPLQSEALMDKFIDAAKIYSKYKEHPIICLGRSPKWFLNAALWMKDGIDDYKFTAFSKYWYRPDPIEGIIRIDRMSPTPEEEKAYRKYLKRIKADPQTIVDNMQKTGKKTIITDYIYSGKGVSSFLDVMSKYAQDLGILKEFCNSIHIVGIGSKDYMSERMNIDYPYDPKVIMPELMRPYEMENLWTYNITQDFYNIDYTMFKEMLINQNTNECRSTYYPHETWTLYKPDQFKTGLVKDLKKVKEMTKTLKGNKSMYSFSPAMSDYRNLLNFRILDGLNSRGLLKTLHKSKI